VWKPSSGKREDLLWEAIQTRCVVALKRNQDNHAGVDTRKRQVSGTPFIVDDAIFPRAVPLRWESRGVPSNASKLISIVTLDPSRGRKELTQRLEYHSFAPTERYPIPPVVQVSSPSEEADDSFRNLYEACTDFLSRMAEERLSGSSTGKKRRPSSAEKSAESEGWLLIQPGEFIERDIGVSEGGR
jgi:hypothetical protein